eukprot:288675_1
MEKLSLKLERMDDNESISTITYSSNELTQTQNIINEISIQNEHCLWRLASDCETMNVIECNEGSDRGIEIIEANRTQRTERRKMENLHLEKNEMELDQAQKKKLRTCNDLQCVVSDRII